MPDHHPPHIYADDTWYMITASTLNHAPLLASMQAKAVVRDEFQDLVTAFGISPGAWVILDDHYHLLLKTKIGRDLARFIGRLHGSTSRNLIYKIMLLVGKYGTTIGIPASVPKLIYGRGSTIFTTIL